MMNKFLLLAVGFLLCWTTHVVQAQTRTISGTVTSAEEGQGLPGVNILVKGSTAGTTSDINGNYTLTVAADAQTLIFSYIGYLTQEIEIGNQSTINIAMVIDTQQLEEVVVTALGIEKQKRSLGYSVTELQGEEFTQARELNLADALSGKVAGVNVSNIGSGVAGSSRVIIRGNTSLAGNNQPLYVIDGVPMDNTQLGSAGMWGGQDWGDGLSSLNPDDIESISVLKGNTAAALYGSRASNGVIVITTKKGTKRKGIGVEFNSNLTLENIINTYDFQDSYGHGNRGQKPTTLLEALDYGATAWGARLDGSPVLQFDGEMRPYSNRGEDNFKNYYRTGSTITNTLALTGGGDKQTFRFSASDLRNESITPNSRMNRQTFTANINSNWVDRLTLSTKIQYSREEVDNRARLSDAPGNGNYTLSVLPPSIDVEDMKGTTPKEGAQEDGTELQYSSNVFSQNPYWAAYQFETKDIRDRVLGSGLLRYDFTDWLYIHGRLGIDWYTSRRTSIEPYGTAYKIRGSIHEIERRVRETNMEFLVGVEKEIGVFNVSAFFGGNRMRREDETTDVGGDNFNIPFFHTISNLEAPVVNFMDIQKGINSLFGSAEFSYKNYVFLTFTGRNDWFSSLNPETNSIFYPSVGASFVFTDAFELPSWISYGKVRASWAQVGGDTEPYKTALNYSLLAPGHLGRPVGRILQDVIPNPDLQPLVVTETEVGFDLKFFGNRLGVDYAFYTRKTEEDILDASISESTGFASATVNIGELTNEGHELLLTATPIASTLKWDISFNFAYNETTVQKLVGDQKVFSAETARSQDAFSQHRIEFTDENGVHMEGGYSLIVGYKQMTIDGMKVYDDNGYPVRGNLEVLGRGVHPYTLGVNNSFNWKNFNLGFLVDMKFGGDLYVGTNASTVGNGMHRMTLGGRENGLTVSGVDESGTPNTWTIAPENLQDYWDRYNDISGNFVEDAGFVKLRQVIFGYNFPNSLLDKTPFTSINLSFVARNLWLIHSNVDNVDPESTYTNGNGQGLEWFGVPQNRSYGFNLNLKL
ncbi:SusC/RagA family TonB-linked outer membrane protein [Rapidithrix thailandica]|uniref:SusC/RagA family TonB-linked outer membrane protein n=1 Tax=Rapidithrix thailandica TaxID=413964 RepID=A0AAW9RUC4_9BACT